MGTQKQELIKDPDSGLVIYWTTEQDARSALAGELDSDAASGVKARLLEVVQRTQGWSILVTQL